MKKTTFLFDGLNRLGKRERKVLGGGMIFVLLLVVWLLILSPLLDRMAWYDRKTGQKEKDLVEMGTLKEDYQRVKNHVDQIERRIDQGKKEFSFPAFLEILAVESKVKNRMTSLRPQASQTFENLKSTEMEVKLEDVTLTQAVNFISRIEESPNFLYIKNLHIKTRYSEPKNLDLTLIVSHYEKLQ